MDRSKLHYVQPAPGIGIIKASMIDLDKREGDMATNIVPAGISNEVSGRRYHGLRELADTDWVVDTSIYVQCESTGNWFRREDESCGCSREQCPANQ